MAWPVPTEPCLGNQPARDDSLLMRLALFTLGKAALSKKGSSLI